MLSPKETEIKYKNKSTTKQIINHKMNATWMLNGRFVCLWQWLVAMMQLGCKWLGRHGDDTTCQNDVNNSVGIIFHFVESEGGLLMKHYRCVWQWANVFFHQTNGRNLSLWIKASAKLTNVSQITVNKSDFGNNDL